MLAEFHFLRPAWLLLLPLLLGLVPLLCRAHAPGNAWRRVIDPGLLPHLVEAAASKRRCLPAALLGVLWALLVLALAGPTWQREPAPLLETRQFHVVLLDLSPSMNAADLAPSRLARARFEVLDLLRVAAEGQTALVAFGPEPYLVAPLTGDAETIALQVPLLETALLPVAGERRTDLALALAGELLEGGAAPAGSVVLVSDGLSPRAGALEAAARLRAAGHQVHVLAVGTAAGAPLAQDGGLLRGSDGSVRLARLDEDGLRALAAAGGGLYRPAVAGDGDVHALVAAAARERAEGEQDTAVRWRDLGPWLVLAALPLALLGFRRGWLGPLVLLLAVLPPQAVRAGAWDELWLTPDQQGARAMNEGRAGAAQELFQRPDWRAAAAHAAGDYAAALQALEGLPPAQSAYNRGNLLARQGDYQAAIEAYETALETDPGDADARHNRDLLRALLARQQAAQQSARGEDAHSNASADSGSEDGQDPASDPSREASADAQDGRDQASQQGEDSAQQGGSGAPQSAAAGAGGSTGDTDAQPGESAAEAEDGASGQTGAAGDPGAGGGDSPDSSASEAGEAADESTSGADPGAGPGATAGTDAAAQGAGQDRGTGAGAGEAAEGDGERAGQGPGGGGGADAAANGDGPAEPGEAAGQADGTPGDDMSDSAGQAGPVDPAGAESLAERAETDTAAGGPDNAPAQGDRAADGQPAPAGARSPGEDEAASATPDGDGQSDVQGGGAGAGDRVSPGRDSDAAARAQSDAARDGGQGEPRGRQGDTPGAAEPAGSGSGSDRLEDAPAGPGVDGQARGPGAAGTGQGAAQPGRPGLADLLGEGAADGTGQVRGTLPGDGPDERRQALEQMLRTVEDDPGGLLRQRFLLQHLRRSGQLP